MERQKIAIFRNDAVFSFFWKNNKTITNFVFGFYLVCKISAFLSLKMHQERVNISWFTALPSQEGYIISANKVALETSRTFTRA